MIGKTRVKRPPYRLPSSSSFVLVIGIVWVAFSMYQGEIFIRKEFARCEIPSYGPVGWSDIKLLIYMTTHLPEHHVVFLPCWKNAIERMDIFKYADGMIYTPTDPSEEQLKMLPFRSTIIKKVPTNIGYQEGAVQAMIDPFLDKNVSWFDNYDWVIKLNADVMIRNDTWFMQTMLNTTFDMIVHDCYSSEFSGGPVLHSDFIAFRPRAVDRDRLLNSRRNTAEVHITESFRGIYDSHRFAFVEGAKNEVAGICRIGGGE